MADRSLILMNKQVEILVDLVSTLFQHYNSIDNDINNYFKHDLVRVIDDCNDILTNDQNTIDELYPGDDIITCITNISTAILRRDNYKDEITRFINIFLTIGADGENINVYSDNDLSIKFREKKTIEIEKFLNRFNEILVEDSEIFDFQN